MSGINRHAKLAERLLHAHRGIGLATDGLRPTHLDHGHAAGDHRGYYDADPDLVGVVARRYREDIAQFGSRYDD